MDYYGLKSIVTSGKEQAELGVETVSFFACAERQDTYVEPKFSKMEFPIEKPTIILVSAVGASGKTSAAHALSYDTGMPILDLAKHKPVGDNTLSGILIEHYPDNVADMLAGLKTGTCGVIIDGIDEGRSKVTEEGFEAFLDNIIKLTKGAERTSIVVFGRGQTLMNTWCYLADNGVATGLIQIEPFNLDQAKKYIDVHVGKPQSGQEANYVQARDEILETLGEAFKAADGEKDEFIAFLGYPPVLDTISTLLRQEGNYHKICQDLSGGSGNDLEVNLLIRIGDYLLDREQREKAQVNFVNDIADKIGGELGQSLQVSLYCREEQCARVLAKTLGFPLKQQFISDLAINQEYENALETWCTEHPFLEENSLRNPVFSALSVARCLLSDIDEYKEIAIKYAEQSPPSYLLLYIMGALHNGGAVPLEACNMLMQSCSDFLGLDANVAIDLEGDSCDDSQGLSEAELAIVIDIKHKDQKKEFSFKADSRPQDEFTLGPILVGVSVHLPCKINIEGKKRIDVFGDCVVAGTNVRFQAPELSISRSSISDIDGKPSPPLLIVESERITGNVEVLSPKDAQLMLFCDEHSLGYPLVSKVAQKLLFQTNVDVQEKYNRLRRIFVDFRSHSKGGLAKYRAKVEHRRVVKNNVGRAVLKKLFDDGILTRDHKFYYVQPAQLSEKIGIHWEDLKQRKSTRRLEEYLANIKI
ncbi:MAG: hypothetical protein AB7D27_13075 [Desulfomicrobium sp.]